jgi:PKD repeat protein
VEYQGAYFFGDYAQGWIRSLRVDANDGLIPGSVQDFALNADGPVAIEMGPDGVLYYIAINAGELRRIQFTDGNTPPVAMAGATPTSGVAPLSVQFASAGSHDPDDDPLLFEWEFGDGATAAGANPQHTYAANGVYIATLTVRDDHGAESSDSVTITVGNLPPVATISAPASSVLFKVGDVIAFSGSAVDPESGQLPSTALTWQVVLHHCPSGGCHTHPYLSYTGAGSSFTVLDHGDDIFFEIILTARDTGGLTHTVSRAIQPRTTQVTLATSPPGLQVVYEGTQQTAPLVRTAVQGSVHTIFAPSPQNGRSFVGWSDGGAQQHTVTMGSTNTTYTANFGCPVGQYWAQYFANRTLSGTPILSRCESTINYNWGGGGPGNGVPSNDFSVRWVGRFNFTAGSKTFRTVSDDGVRLWVDNQLVIDFWTDHSATTRTATRNMTAGEHEVKVEYYERSGQAVIQVSW